VVPTKELDVVVIGAGITGIGVAYYLQANGISYKMLEQDDDVGGIWNTQRWHGARCDSAFIKYSFSFMPYISDKYLQDREQIHDYLRTVANKFSIIKNIHFKTQVTKARFDSREKKWTIYTTNGIFYSRFIINGNGYFSAPNIPTFPDADKFKGEIIHTFNLDAHRTFDDKNVVVVGSGSTAICCVPELAKVAKSLVLLQRSPSYIYEIDNQATRTTMICQNLYKIGIHFPLKILRYYLQFKDDMIFLIFRRFPRFARWIFREHWLPVVGVETFREHFIPKYQPWEQRVCIAVGLKEKIAEGKIKIKTSEIQRLTESSIILTNGETIPCDTCILATGFHFNLLKFDLYIDEHRIVDFGGVNYYKGVMLGGIPNYFQPIGVLHSAWTQRSETATKYAIKIMKYMKKNGYRSVSIDRREVNYTPAITPNYIMRCLPTLPKIYGSWELPSFDNIFSYRFNPANFNFL